MKSSDGLATVFHTERVMLQLLLLLLQVLENQHQSCCRERARSVSEESSLSHQPCNLVWQVGKWQHLNGLLV